MSRIARLSAIVKPGTRLVLARSTGIYARPASSLRRTFMRVMSMPFKRMQPVFAGVMPARRVEQFPLSVAVDSGNRQNLAASDFETDVVKLLRPAPPRPERLSTVSRATPGSRLLR